MLLGPNICVTETLAAGWRGGLAGAEQFEGNSDLRKALSSAMNAWFSNDFHNIACLDFGGGSTCSCGTPGFWNRNWFSNVSHASFAQLRGLKFQFLSGNWTTEARRPSVPTTQ